MNHPTEPASEPVFRQSHYDADEDPDAFWRLCLALAGQRRAGNRPSALRIDESGAVQVTDAADPRAKLKRVNSALDLEDARWQLQGAWSPVVHEMMALYRPLLDLAPLSRFVTGHLGQSLDGRIATGSGDSCFINGPQNLVHLHRLRALCDAVLVGAGTVVADDPQLTTRRVAGCNATRVVLDPSNRLTSAYRLCSDAQAPTLLVRYAAAAPGVPADRTEVITAPRGQHGIDLAALLDTLAARGLRAVLVEGGGVTVSRFLAAGLLDRLQIAVAPLIIGSGRPGLQLPEISRLGDCLRPVSRQFRMGDDTLWDLSFAASISPRSTLD